MEVAKIKVVTESEGTGKATAELEKLDKTVNETGESTSGLGSIFEGTMGTLAAGVGTIVAVAAAMKQVYEAGREGAIVQQTAESFERLAGTLPANIDLLQQLRDAASGTVDDMTLMSSTLTLVAGTSGEMQTALLQATPQLMEIAKAANKLNPTLGDTAFLYESISTGIKRNSPLILDNLGIVIKVGEANEKYAASLGKTTDELTATESTMALLNGTLEAGNTLIEQAGGAAGSAVDPYNKLEAQTKTLTDASKKLLVDGLKPIVEYFADLVEGMNEATDQTSILKNALDAGLITMEQYGSLTNSARYATEHYDEQVELLRLQLELMNSEAPKTLDFFDMYAPAAEEAAAGTEVLEEAVSETNDELQTQLESLQAVTDALYKSGDASDEFARKMEAAKYNIAVNREELGNLGETVDILFAGGLIKAEDVVSANALIGIDAVMQEMRGGIISQSEAVKTMRDDFGLAWGEAQGYISGAVDPLQNLSDLLGGLDVTEMQNLGLSALDLAASFGIPLSVAQSIIEALDLLNGKEVSATVRINTTGNSGLLGGVMPTGYTDYQERATGGSGIVSSPTLFLAGETGTPERYSFEPLGSSSGGSSMDTERLIQELRMMASQIGTEVANALIVAEGR